MIAGCGFSRLIPQGKVYHQQDASTSSPSGHLFCCMLPQHAGERRLLKSRRLRPRENAHGRTQAQAPPSADDCRMSPIPSPAGSLCRIAYAEGSLKPFWGKRRPALQNSGTPAAKNGLWRPQAAPRRNAGQGAETEKSPRPARTGAFAHLGLRRLTRRRVCPPFPRAGA